MNKIFSLKILLISGALILNSFYSAAAEIPVNTTKKPNFVVFVVDDHDAWDMPVYEKDKAACAPVIEKLAGEGIVYERAYLTTSVCTPSRYTLYTGRYPGRCMGDSYLKQVPLGSQNDPEFNIDLEKDGTNVAAVLAKNGYVTGHVGKFHVGDEEKLKEIFGQARPKFDKRTPEASAYLKKAELAYRKYMTDIVGFTWAKHVYWANMENSFTNHNPKWTLEAALEFIEENKDKPFYLHYCTTLVHGPLNWEISMRNENVTGEGVLASAPKVDGMRSNADIIKESKSGKGESDLRDVGLTWVDASAEVIIKKLKDLGLDDNTVFIYIADNGISGKSSMYEGGIRACMFMRYPAGIKAGSKFSGLVSSADIVPTIFDLASVKKPDDYRIDGVSLRPSFDNPNASLHNDVYAELGAARAVVKGDFKYVAVRYKKSKADSFTYGNPAVLVRRLSYIFNPNLGQAQLMKRPAQYTVADQLYNLKDDPAEAHNLAQDPKYAAKLAEMKGLLLEYLKTFNRPYGEFIEGQNAVAPSVWNDKVLEALKNVEVSGKRSATLKNADGTVKDIDYADGGKQGGKAKKPNSEDGE